MRWLRKVPKVVLAALWTAAFFAVVEFLLFLSGSFDPVAVVEEREWEGGTFWVDNPRFTRFVLDRHNVSVPQSLWLATAKDPETTRVVLIGESAAAGYPVTGLSLARVVDAMWRLRFPDAPIEVANLTSVGVNSHVLRRFTREALKLQPDVIVIYAGHNEIIGPYGPAAVFGMPLPAAWLAQLSLTVRNTRFGRAVARLLDMSGVGGEKEKSWQGLAAFAGAEFSFEDESVKQAAKQTAENFRAIIRAAQAQGVKVLVCVPAVNLTEWPPLASEDNQDRSAMHAYRTAMDLQARGEQNAAWKFYRHACDLDLRRIRADSRTRQVQRDVAAEFASPDVAIVDADIWLHEKNPTFQTDRTYFLEHVHLTFEGRVAVAELIVDGLDLLLRPGEKTMPGEDTETWWRLFPEKVAAARQTLLYTEYHEAEMTDSIADLFEQDLFRSSPWLQADKIRRRESARTMRQEASKKWTPSHISEKHTVARARSPLDDEVDHSAAMLLLSAGEEESAKTLLREALIKRPNNARARMVLARLALDRRDYGEAERQLAIQTYLDPEEVGLAGMLAETFAAQGKFAEAIPYLQKNLREHPNDPSAVGNLGMTLQMVGRTKEALANFESYLSNFGEDPRIANNYAWLTATSDRPSRAELLKAVELARRATASEPTSHRYRGTLSVALAAAGYEEEAELVADQALQMARDAGDEKSANELALTLRKLKRDR